MKSAACKVAFPNVVERCHDSALTSRTSLLSLGRGQV
jgi:hypothetical protein